MEQWTAWLRGFKPAPIAAARREKLVGCLGAWVGLMVTQWVCRFAFGDLNPWFIAPMGASAVLLFALPASPLAQPWSIIGGNVVSALIGVTCARWLPDPLWAAGVAVPLAIAAMFALRCLHPPSGAVALMAVLGGPDVLASGYRFVLLPVGANSALLLVSALLFNNLMRRRYPHAVVVPLHPHRTADPQPSERVGVTRADIDAALHEHRELLDVQPDDLEDIVLRAELHAYRRHAGNLRCADIMSRDVVTVDAAQPVQAAWQLLQQHHIKALPVTGADGSLAGIVSLHDLLLWRQADDHAPRAERIAQMMTRAVRTARAEQALGELVPLFSDRGFHHLPVIDAQRKVIGMVTQSDLIAAMYRTGIEKEAA